MESSTKLKVFQICSKASVQRPSNPTKDAVAKSPILSIIMEADRRLGEEVDRRLGEEADRRLGEEVNWESYQTVLLPVCHQHHWFLLVASMETATISVLDSLPHAGRAQRFSYHWRFPSSAIHSLVPPERYKTVLGVHPIHSSKPLHHSCKVIS
ncbi:hypothetical protein KP79_PYT06928 [Mizuhopecten yessoensis]|uniref:Ubiquitin-like protease family profile domain-containing protein n=1 Tax=Mizuhopecten yessoensis TaxID=6573 RepID=A0A210Q7I1_MIZYE|nr:hypothetical protein KP79_PYT06928 [Mizuhopecten yessoensis]